MVLEAMFQMYFNSILNGFLLKLNIIKYKSQNKVIEKLVL